VTNGRVAAWIGKTLKWAKGHQLERFKEFRPVETGHEAVA
jgi:hypothetical protein